jgi:hypothetical protein
LNTNKTKKLKKLYQIGIWFDLVWFAAGGTVSSTNWMRYCGQRLQYTREQQCTEHCVKTQLGKIGDNIKNVRQTYQQDNK